MLYIAQVSILILSLKIRNYKIIHSVSFQFHDEIFMLNFIELLVLAPFHIFNGLLCSDVLSDFLHILFRVNNLAFLSFFDHIIKLEKCQAPSNKITLDMTCTTSGNATHSPAIFLGNWEFVPERSIFFCILCLIPKCSYSAIFQSQYFIVASISRFTRHLLR